MASRPRRENKEIAANGHVESRADGCQVLKSVPSQGTEGRRGVSKEAEAELSESRAANGQAQCLEEGPEGLQALPTGSGGSAECRGLRLCKGQDSWQLNTNGWSLRRHRQCHGWVGTLGFGEWAGEQGSTAVDRRARLDDLSSKDAKGKTGVGDKERGREER